MLHVGDSLRSDVAGATDAGVHSVWLNREGAANDTEIRPDYEVAALTEIPEQFWDWAESSDFRGSSITRYYGIRVNRLSRPPV